MGDLALEAAEVVNGLASRGAPAPDGFVRRLAEAGQTFAALRAEAFEVARSLGLPVPGIASVRSAADLDEMLRVLLATAEALEQRAAMEAARASAVAVLDRAARLVHGSEPGFEPLRRCQERARQLRTAVLEATDVDAAATVPFAALVRFVDSPDHVDDAEWQALHDTVAAAFGPRLAMAAGRGRLLATED
jgi:hypothetical protein